ncbi:spermatogenesis-associated protein 6-like isoform X2 [Anneissia japonica]|uniref:spermatogenesis-associated protein 6-like isoform X2 n=1 Tax=Anneissia japonica TaxID=1529436 RepID=UPI001425A661|nr:spermatogenesis-associated protein 6-like isoform X2 [Anneissia japonica]
MPRKALRLTVDLNVHAVTCPGSVLSSREDVYLQVVMLGQQRRTLCLPPVFPFLFHQVLTFDRTFTNCMDPAHLTYILQAETVIIELIQLPPDYYSDGQLLAYHRTSARDFLYPEDTLTPAYADADREILLKKTVWFNGISPKLEFSCVTTVRDSTSATYNEFKTLTVQDPLQRIVSISPAKPRGRTKKKPKSYEFPTTSSLLRSPQKQLTNSTKRKPRTINSTLQEDRPPFICKRIDTHNRAVSPPRARSVSPRRPASAPPKSLRRSPAKSAISDLGYVSENDCTICKVYKRYYGHRYWGHRYNYHPNNGIKYEMVGPNKKKAVNFDSVSTLSEDTEELLEDISHLKISSLAKPIPGVDVEYGRLPYSPRSPRRARTRSLSPTLMKSSLRERLGDYSLNTSRNISHKIRRALDRNFESVDIDDVSTITSDEALDNLRSSISPSQRSTLDRSFNRRYINY